MYWILTGGKWCKRYMSVDLNELKVTLQHHRHTVCSHCMIIISIDEALHLWCHKIPSSDKVMFLLLSVSLYVEKGQGIIIGKKIKYHIFN